jgi:protein O-GlcNAc transferase
LPELVTQSLEEYEAPALKLARESAFLSAYRERLEENRPTAPLFDTVPFCAHLELMRPCLIFTSEGRLREASRSR